MLTNEGTPVGEGVEFTDGSVVLRWLTNDIVSRFASMDIVHNIHPSFAVVPVGHEPMADRLRRKRKAEGLSQRALAKKLRMSFSTISRIEGGENYVMTKELNEWLDNGQWDGPSI